ncbi:protein ELF [Salix suchowensis]|nr:protein ELF [Salix suchowensis]
MCMTKLESSSLVEEQAPTLDNNTGTAIAPPKPYKKGVKDGGGEAKNGEEEEECDVEAWDTLSKSFKQVQSVLDHNRDLIQQVNSNHRSKIPDNLVKNVSLIREINGNISKVISIYSDLSVNFSNIVQERRRRWIDGWFYCIVSPNPPDVIRRSVGTWATAKDYSGLNFVRSR